MTTSGTVTFRTNRDEVIKGALRLVNGYDPENSAGPTATQITNCSEALNLLLKSWEVDGLLLWERRWAVIFPQPDQPVFALGSPGPAGDHACLSTPLGAGGFLQTTLAADAASGALTIVVETKTSPSTAGISAMSITTGYNIGIELDDGTVQWTTVNGTPASTTVTITAALTDDASEGNSVFCYQTKLVRPLRVIDGFVRNIASGNDTPINIIPRENYNRFGQKSTAAGVPTQIYYDPQSNIGYLYIYPCFEAADSMLFIEFARPIEDITTSTQDYDMPQEWGAALKFNLALHIAPEYEVPTEKFKQIVTLAKDTKDMVDSWDEEWASLYLQPNLPVAYPRGS